MGKNGKTSPYLHKLLTDLHHTYMISEQPGLVEEVPAHGGRVERDDP